MTEVRRANLYVVESSTISGGEPPEGNDLEARVSNLEKQLEKMDGKLDRLLSESSTVKADVSFVKGKLDTMPTARDFGELKGRVDSLPTIAKVASLLGIGVACIALLNNWVAIKAALLG